MSVSIVSNEHINAILHYLHYNNVQIYRNGKWLNSNDYRREEIGALLLNANIASYNARYSNNLDSVQSFNYQPDDWVCGIQLVKLCHCLAYQCAEMPNWRGSIEKQILDAIIYHAISNTAEYIKAEWSI